ncbi:MAG TPA: endonuclease III [Nitrososphaerales archaeon]|nr:endonuclease III [Nitrososphaerales archaeon]
MADRKQADLGPILREIAKMVRESKDPRATALAELKDAEDGNPFRILIGTILSQRTRDERTTLATERLFRRFKGPRELAGAKEDEVRELIRPAGFYNMKAKSIIKVAKQLVEEFGGEVPSDLEALMSLPSVGRKTANCVLVYGFDEPAIPVDTHVHRISNRLGLVETKTPEQTEAQLVKSVPKRYWLELNELFVRFGQTTCKPVGPRCGECTLRARCKYYRQVVRPKQLKTARAR